MADYSVDHCVKCGDQRVAYTVFGLDYCPPCFREKFTDSFEEIPQGCRWQKSRQVTYGDLADEQASPLEDSRDPVEILMEYETNEGPIRPNRWIGDSWVRP